MDVVTQTYMINGEISFDFVENNVIKLQLDVDIGAHVGHIDTNEFILI